MDCIYHNAGDNNFQSLGVFSTLMDLGSQPILVRMSCNVGKCKLHGSKACSCNRRCQFIVVVEKWAKVIICTVMKFVIFVHILLEIKFSRFLSTGIDFPMSWSRFLIIPRIFVGGLCIEISKKSFFRVLYVHIFEVQRSLRSSILHFAYT